MPRSGGGRSRSRSGSSYASPTRPSSPPQKQPNQSNGPNYGKQAAAVAGGVVAGSMISSALFGPRVAVMERDETQAEVEDPCAKELLNFVECAKRSADLRDCEGFNELLKQCRKKFGPPPVSK